MANELIVGKLRAILGLDTAQYEAGARKAAAVNKQLASEMKRAQEQIRQFAVDSRSVTFKEMVAGMSAAGKQATSSARMIAGMSAAGREATAVNHAMASSISALQAPLKMMAVGIAGAFTVGAVVGFAKEVGNFAGQMMDLSSETGIGVERLQAFNVVASGVGLTIEDIARAINQLTIRVAGGDNSALGALDRLGISAQKFVSLSADERLLEVADAMAKVGSATEKTTIAADLFGTKVGPRALRFLNSELRHTIEELERSGVVIDEELIKKADEFDDMWAKGWIAFRAYAATAINAVIEHWRQLDALIAGGAFGTFTDIARAVVAMTGHKAEVERQQRAAPPNPLGLPAQARAGLPGEADIKELDRRVEDATRKNLERERAAQEAAAKTAEAAERAARAYNDAQERARAAQREKLSADEALALDKIEEAAESYRLMIEVVQELAVEASKTDAILDKLADDAAKSASEAANEMGLAWMLADKAVMDAEKERADEIRMLWDRVAADMTFAITDGFAMMLTGMRSFKDSMIGIWQEIRSVIAGILSKMLADFIGGYVRKAVAAMAGAAVAGATLQAGAGTAAAAASGVGGASAGAGGGVGALVGLATNPFTIAAAGGVALALLIGKTGLFRGGEEGTQVNPRRDRFVGQFGPGGTGVGSGFSNLATMLRSPTLFGALMAADTVKEYEAAQSSAIGRLAMRGVNGIRAFNMGGFVPPGVTMPAILHGGAFGEDVVPRGRSGSGVTHIHNHIVIKAWDATDMDRAVDQHLIPRLNRASQHNTGEYRTQHLKGFGLRPAYR